MNLEALAQEIEEDAEELIAAYNQQPDGFMPIDNEIEGDEDLPF